MSKPSARIKSVHVGNYTCLFFPEMEPWSVDGPIDEKVKQKVSQSTSLHTVPYILDGETFNPRLTFQSLHSDPPTRKEADLHNLTRVSHPDLHIKHLARGPHNFPPVLLSAKESVV